MTTQASCLGSWRNIPLTHTAVLTNAEGRLLAGLLRGKSREEIAANLGWRRDTLDRRLALLRDRLGFENVPLLLRALAATKPRTTTTARGSTS